MSIEKVASITKEFAQQLDSERANRIEWWRILRILKDEYGELLDSVKGQFDMDSFDLYVERNYGVKISYNQQGNIEGFYEIVDKNKHLIFLMKYSK